MRWDSQVARWVGNKLRDRAFILINNSDFVFATDVQIGSRAQTAYFQWVSGVLSLQLSEVTNN
jgi:hypothetical protein